MASHYINNFSGSSSRKDVLNIVSDFYEIKTLDHYLRHFVREDMRSSSVYDWKRKYRTKGYMNMVITEYIEYVQVLKEVQGFKEVKSDKVNEKRKEILNVFFRKNIWHNIFKSIAKYRKLYGDVYLYWFMDEDKKTKISYPKLKILDSRYVTPMTDLTGDIYAYEYLRSVKYKEEEKRGKDIEYTEKEKEVKWVFTADGQHIYEDNKYVKTIPNSLDGEMPIVHLQHMREDKDDSPYSEVPSEPLLDLCLALDFLETWLSQTNATSGAPQMIVIDGNVTEDSIFGANGIIYVETKDPNYTEGENGELEYNPTGGNSSVKQAKVQQLEITNGLDSLIKQKQDLENTLYMKANLIPPSLLEKLSSSDSSKVINAIKLDLEQEVRYFYEEMSDKFEILFTKMFEANKALKKGEMISLKIPETALNSTIFDKYLLKAQKMELGELTMKENLRESGFTEKQILEHIKELNEEIFAKNKDKSSSAGATTPATNKAAKEKSSPAQYEKKGVDNNLKNKIGGESKNEKKQSNTSGGKESSTSGKSKGVPKSGSTETSGQGTSGKGSSSKK